MSRFGDSFVIEFDTDVIIQEFNFSSIDDDGGFFIVEVEGVATPFNFANALLVTISMTRLQAW